MNDSFEPKILALICNWCTYTAADLAGVSRMKYAPNLRVVRTMCSGRVNPLFVMSAISKGADGVLIGGCHFGDCHYLSGNYQTQKRVKVLHALLEGLGIDPRRLRLEWISASEGRQFALVVDDFVTQLKQLGPNPLQRAKRCSTT